MKIRLGEPVTPRWPFFAMMQVFTAKYDKASFFVFYRSKFAVFRWNLHTRSAVFHCIIMSALQKLFTFRRNAVTCDDEFSFPRLRENLFCSPTLVDTQVDLFDTSTYLTTRINVCESDDWNLKRSNVDSSHKTATPVNMGNGQFIY